ncbi:hypothetical protein BH10ACI2_BH10ACI2_00480 [soil metagenome]
MSKLSKAVIDRPLFWPIFAATSIAIGFGIVFICRQYLEPPKDTEIGLPVMVAYVALLAIAAQIVVNIRQWHSMEAGLHQTRELFEMAERPSIGIESIGFVGAVESSLLQIVIINSGRVPAINLEVELLEHLTEPQIGPCPDPSGWIGHEQTDVTSQEVIGISGRRILHAGSFDATAMTKTGKRENDLFLWLKCT